MCRVRCPECGIEFQREPKYGEEVTAVYCLKHRGGADQHLRPVYMTPVLDVPVPPKEPVLA